MATPPALIFRLYVDGELIHENSDVTLGMILRLPSRYKGRRVSVEIEGSAHEIFQVAIATTVRELGGQGQQFP